MTEAEWLTHAARHPHAALLYVWDGHDTPPCRPPPDATYAQHVLEHVPHLAQHQQVSRVALWNPRTVACQLGKSSQWRVRWASPYPMLMESRLVG